MKRERLPMSLSNLQNHFWNEEREREREEKDNLDAPQGANSNRGLPYFPY